MVPPLHRKPFCEVAYKVFLELFIVACNRRQCLLDLLPILTVDDRRNKSQ